MENSPAEWAPVWKGVADSWTFVWEDGLHLVRFVCNHPAMYAMTSSAALPRTSNETWNTDPQDYKNWQAYDERLTTQTATLKNIPKQRNSWADYRCGKLLHSKNETFFRNVLPGQSHGPWPNVTEWCVQLAKALWWSQEPKEKRPIFYLQVITLTANVQGFLHFMLLYRNL